MAIPPPEPTKQNEVQDSDTRFPLMVLFVIASVPAVEIAPPYNFAVLSVIVVSLTVSSPLFNLLQCSVIAFYFMFITFTSRKMSL